MKPLTTLLVAGLLAGLFAPRWLPQTVRGSCCCPDGMLGACSRMDTGCSLKQCPAGDSAALSLSAPRILLPSSPALPAPAGAGFLALLEARAAPPPSADPSDPPPRG
ncbi:MAG TPA: hypothetical protein VGK86_04970 [Thermoanaerobaculia bacterium]